MAVFDAAGNRIAKAFDSSLDPQALTFLHDGSILTSDWSDLWQIRFNADAGFVVSVETDISADFNSWIYDIHSDCQGNVFVVDRDENQDVIRQYSYDGASFTLTRVLNTNGACQYIYGLTSDGNGKVLSTCYNKAGLLLWNEDGAFQGKILEDQVPAGYRYGNLGIALSNEYLAVKGEYEVLILQLP